MRNLIKSIGDLLDSILFFLITFFITFILPAAIIGGVITIAIRSIIEGKWWFVFFSITLLYALKIYGVIMGRDLSKLPNSKEKGGT